MAKESSYGIARDSTAHKRDSVGRSGVRVLTAERRWTASVIGTAQCCVSQVLSSRPASGPGAQRTGCKRRELSVKSHN